MASSKVSMHQLAVALFAVAAIASVFQAAVASDEDPLQDFCVAILPTPPNPPAPPLVNGFQCKAAKDTTAEDFKSSVLATPGTTDGFLKASVTVLNVGKFAGLNTLGISGARIDFAVGGLNPPHVHPRATELLFVIYGELEVGFVATDVNNTLYTTIIKQGDAFVFPRGLVHFQKNRGYKPALAVAALNSQNPGASQVAKALFAATPKPIDSDILEQALNVGGDIVQKLLAAQ